MDVTVDPRSDRPSQVDGACDGPCPDSSACASNADCVLGYRVNACCACATAYARTYVEAAPCVVAAGEPRPPACEIDCSRVRCGPCAGFVAAECVASQCEGRDTCLAGDVLHPNGCDRPCLSHFDCLAAANYASCCNHCDAYLATDVVADPCLYSTTEGDPPGGCISAASCVGLGCPSVTPCLETAAVCLDGGLCHVGACPGGTVDNGTICTPES
jgi:hypothetical protein